MARTAQPEALLVSDIHLPAGPSEYRDAFHALLGGPARRCHALFLLGDIFEYWLGDDVSGRDHRTTLEALQACAEGGTHIYFMAGNRDFLVSPALLRRYGVTRLPDPVSVALPDGMALLSHGDQWCTQDQAYQRWRRFAHTAFVQRAFRALPSLLRRRIAERLRARSQMLGRMTADDLLDVDNDSVEQAFQRYAVARIIHGHTHRPAHHQMQGGQRIVLPDWRPGEHAYLQAQSGGLTTCRME